MYRSSIFLLLFFVLFQASNAQPVINTISENNNSIGRYNKYELTVDLTAAFTNPFDYAQVSLRGIFTSPNNITDTVDGFYYQDYSLNTTTGALTKNGAPTWKIRFSPDTIGSWNYKVICSDMNGSTASSVQTFTCVTSSEHGYVRKTSSNYFKHDDNTTYFAIGENMGWYDNTRTVMYKRRMDSLALYNANYMRVWMADWAMGIEWSDSTLGNYSKRSDRAFELDYVTDYAAQKGLFIQLCLNYHGAYSSSVDPDWAYCPYNAVNGGPCTNAYDFFTNTTAKNFIKQRFRYINARWGYSSHILSWELFNEVDWIDSYATQKANVTAWHQEMAQYIKKIDVNKHLITTSYADNTLEPATWNLAEMDYTQTHFYSSTSDPAPIHNSFIGTKLSTYNKPTLIGEYGLPDNNFCWTNDPNGISQHNMLWASAMSGSFGVASIWWWDSYIDSMNLYKQFKPINTFTSADNFVTANYQPVVPTCSSTQYVTYSVTPGYGTWGKCPDNAFTVSNNGTISPSSSGLSTYLFGATYNTANRNPPTFTVNYSQAGVFAVVTGANKGTTPKITVKLDGVTKINNVAAATNTTYTISVTAGPHTIFVDNQGTDWIEIASYDLVNYIPALRSYVLQSANKTTGWVQNINYNWKYINANGTPAAVTGAVNLTGLIPNGGYDVDWHNTSTATNDSATTALADASGNLNLPVYNVIWDRAFRLTYNPLISVNEKNALSASLNAFPNPFNNNTMIKYTLDTDANVKLIIYDALGREVKMLVNEKQSAGAKQIEWNGTSTAGAKIERGIYFCRMMMNNKTGNKKLIYIE